MLNSHAMLATIIKMPELMLAPQEANLLANGMNEVAKHYDLTASQKALDWSNLIMLAATIYGPRIFAYRARQPVKEPAPTAFDVRPPQRPQERGPTTNPPREIEIPGVGKVARPDLN